MVLHRHIWKGNEKRNGPKFVEGKTPIRNDISVANILNTSFASVFNKDDDAHKTNGKVI